MDHVLDNPAWNALVSGNKHLAYGNNEVKFFDKEVSPFVGFKANTDADFNTLYNLLPHDGPVGFISETAREIPAEWQVMQVIPCFQMIYKGNAKPVDVTVQPIPLTTAHVPQMVALTKLTNPGPFARRTIEFGHYYGFFEDDKLVAMAGQRMHPEPYAEISAVCTHPDHLGKGLAQQLLLFHINRIIAAQGIPMLHVRNDNNRAVAVYKRVGFEIRREVWFYIMKKA
jgi:predicted GNAT family acetyltransferase